MLKRLRFKLLLLLRLAPEIFNAAHCAHRGKQRVCFFMNDFRAFSQIFDEGLVNQQLVAAAIDYNRGMLSAKTHNFSPFAHRGVIRAFHMHKHTELVRRLHILLLRYICVKTDMVKPE